jgi:hypothetical protein
MTGTITNKTRTTAKYAPRDPTRRNDTECSIPTNDEDESTG